MCTCLTDQFAFFSRAESGVLLTVNNAQATSATFSINQSPTNVARNQAAPSSRVFQLKTIQATASTSFSCAGKRGVLIETRSFTGPRQTTRRRASRTPVSSRNYSCFSWLSSTYRCRQELNGLATLYVEVAPLLRMLFSVDWGLWKSLALALLYIDVAVRPSSEALFFFDHSLPRFLLMEAPLVRQAQPTVEVSPLHLSNAMEALLEFDD